MADESQMEKNIEEIVKKAVERERHECAKIAWKMRMYEFGGGTAIGNAIANRGDKEITSGR